jgi:DNA-binding MarR family transcriptional regulator
MYNDLHMKSNSEGPNTLLDAVLSVSRVLVAVAARSLADIAEEVTLAQYRTLVVLASRGPQNLTGLAEAVGVTPATATRMCDRLITKELIVREAGIDDRRNIRIELSAAGQRLVRDVTDRRRQEISTILAMIAPTDQVIFATALSRFALAAGEVPEQDWSTGWDL